MTFEKKLLKIDGAIIACEYKIKNRNAVILHGAGKAERTRYYAIANELLKRNVGAVLFDFSGHGESSGNLSESSLERRKNQAEKVINTLLPKGELYMLGFSMGAQTVCDLLPHYSGRLRGIVLACPAIYSKDALKLKFGDSEFTKLLGTEGSWNDSLAYHNLGKFDGRTVIAIGDQDEVIPKGVLDLLKSHAKHITYIEYPNVTHQLAAWLSNNPDELSKLMENLIKA